MSQSLSSFLSSLNACGLQLQKTTPYWRLYLAGGLVVSAALTLGVGVIGSQFSPYQPPSASAQAVFEPMIDTSPVVEVSGAVVNPGLYPVATGQRIGEAIRLAGGWTDQADQAWIAQSLQLAQPVEDGQKIYIPFQGQSSVVGPSSGAQSVVTLAEPVEPVMGLVSINTASQAELEDLPGIGEKRAESIIENRPYQNLDELLERAVLTEKLFTELSPSLTL